jgi:hypothetical protein
MAALVPLLALLWAPGFRLWRLDTASIGSSGGGARLIDPRASFARFNPRIPNYAFRVIFPIATAMRHRARRCEYDS